jgi:O-antigen/teichoic acid export membrane protein
MVFRGSLMELLGFGGTQALRLAGNLVLSRLLFPEAFGLAAIVSVFLTGLQLLSDVGLEPSVVQNERGADRRFLSTVWTLQIVRGAALAVLAVFLAVPAAALYREPQLAPLMAVAGLAPLIAGFNSTAIYVRRREVRLAPLVALEVAARASGLAVMIAWAWWRPSVWALVVGGVVDAVVTLALSHRLRRGERDRLGWDPEAARAVVHFGKWIFLSSAVFFFGRQGDRLLLGQFLGMRVLGVYNIALFLSEAVGMAINRVTHGVFFPVFSRAARDGAERLREVYYAARLRTDLLAVPALGALAVLGDDVVRLLYDERYAEAGWILQALCLRVAMSCILDPCETCLFALGHTRYGFLSNVAMTAWIWIAIPVGWWLAGLEGLVIATSLSGVPILVTLWPAFRRLGLLRPEREAIAIAGFAAGAGLGWSLQSTWQALLG